MKKLKLMSWKLTMIAVIVALTAACGNNGGNGGNEQAASPSPTAEATAEATEQPAATEAPAENLVDEAQVEELLAQFKNQEPTKLIAMSVALTELFDALGVAPAGVPVTSSKLPAAFDALPRVGSSHQPDLEVIAGLQPDAVIGPASIKENLEKQFSAAKLPTAYLPADSLDELKLSTVVLGRLLKKEAEADALIKKFNEDEKAAMAAVEGKTAPSVLVLFGSAESLMFMNENTYVGSLVKNLGGKNVVSDVLKLTETYTPLDMESVVTANPDIILLVAHGDPEAVAKKLEEDVKNGGAWDKLNAFKNDKLIALDYGLFGIASLPKAVSAYNELAGILYE
ncbi:ABC transporter substrate-binding protein [Paenibacillus sp. LHD-117]|uniref:ABC transporter substrate-binding protein n=1 Tax=Paenibacillus sp. LHD-117 TaxID=3071412 RepID=UPI0027E1F148|nr:ABC transporter substrate-binding protein [Paenibacillus sp. LHD-117]MDQ6418843.1 ABC transporter substrate-binding protein [Paenibacillus sp. LHD-117]